MHYLAVDDKEPAGKPVALCNRVSIRLTVHDIDEDLKVYKDKGLSGLRQHRLLPTCVNIQFIGSGQTHKKEIISLYLNSYLVPSICQRTNQSKDAVERYIRDFEAIRLLDSKFDNINSISLITRLSKSVVQQYIELIPMYN